MTPAKAAGASKPSRATQPPARVVAKQARYAKRPPATPSKDTDAASPAVTSNRATPGRVGRSMDQSADRTGKVARSPARGGAGTSIAPERGVSEPRPPTRASGAAGARSVKSGKKPITKETVNKAVTSTTSRTTKDTHSSAAHAPDTKPARRADKATSAGPYAEDAKFLAEQRQLLESERDVYMVQASDLKAEADSLAQEREPGDVQFDEESGEGGTVTVDRERDLALSAQALAAVAEIDAALAKIASGTYGACERCGEPIPKARLKALPYARLCVACKSGGLSRR
jgi:DnaK suppressor protein